MMKKLTLLTAAGVGYVLGTRAGRERYDQIVASVQRIAGNPKVQDAAHRAQDTVAQQAPVVADAMRDKASSAASTVADKMPGGSRGSSAGQPTSPQV